MMREKKPQVQLTPEDEVGALFYFQATMHFPKEVRERGDLAAEREHLARISPETLRSDPEGLEIALRKLTMLKEAGSFGAIAELGRLWRETHLKK